jgi:hypothetical protein
MSHSPAETPKCRLDVSTRQWQRIDACIDNEVDVEVVNGDPKGVVEAGHGIREQGWRQIAGWEPGGSRSAWPPADATVSVELTLSEWELVLSCVERWSRVGDPAEGQIDAELRSLVATQIAEQVPGWAPPTGQV